MKKELLNIATVSLNQTPLKWKQNAENIIDSIKESFNKNAELVLLPELAVTGYGCEDLFLSQDFNNKAYQMLTNIMKEVDDFLSDKERDLVYCLGIPVMIEGGQLFNGVAVLSKGKIHGIVCKQNLAKNGIHYEQRWFQPWQKELVISWNGIPTGDLVFSVSGIKFGFEICEDSWIPNRPARSLYSKQVDLVLNPSASHFAIGKQKTREQFVKEGSRAFGVAYAYSNLMGCEAGRAIFDGGNIIASGGNIVSRGKRLSFEDYNINIATVDIMENRSTKIISSESMDLNDYENNLITLDISIDSKSILSNKIKEDYLERTEDELIYAISF